MADGRNRNDVKIGREVEIVQKQDQRTGDLTNGFVKKILTKSAFHPHGIKVMLETGEVGRVKEILEE
ncbi:YwbE family protein [Fulvivirgaceae bacterium LMO-SS25]